jgi:hypothetical protein
MIENVLWTPNCENRAEKMELKPCILMEQYIFNIVLDYRGRQWEGISININSEDSQHQNICFNEQKCILKFHLHKQWHFWFLSRLIDFARLSVQFCHTLWPILRQEMSYLSVWFCAMWCSSVRCLQQSDRWPGKIGRIAKIRPVLAVSCKQPLRLQKG